MAKYGTPAGRREREDPDSIVDSRWWEECVVTATKPVRLECVGLDDGHRLSGGRVANVLAVFTRRRIGGGRGRA